MLEERLPHLVREIEDRLAEAKRQEDDRRIAAEHAADVAQQETEEHRRRWRVLLEQAAEQLLLDHRATVLRNDANAWSEAERMRAYCDAAETKHGNRPDTAEWLAWARAYAAALDPLTDAPTMPSLSEVTQAELESFLPEGWSAVAADHGWRPSPCRRW